MSSRTAAYFFCMDAGRDPVAHHVFDALAEEVDMYGAGWTADGREVLQHDTSDGDRMFLVRTDKVLSHDYPRYLPNMSEHLSECAMAGVVNWHEGENAPDRVLTVHTTGDMASGNYGAASPAYVRALLVALETERSAAHLDDFTTEIEGTHWSGIPYVDADPALIGKYDVPVMDIEIGSTPRAWSNALAAKVVARVLPRVFSHLEPAARSVLGIGGVHFERGFLAAVLPISEEAPLALSHVLPNHWLVSGAYETEEGYERLRRCVDTIDGGVQLIVFHDKLKGSYKSQARRLAEELGVPAVKHQRLRDRAGLPL